MLFARYLAFRPNDAAAQAEFARLVISLSDRPDAPRKELLQAYGALDTAVRKNPGDDELRRTLVNWMMRFGRFADAINEIDFLRERGVSPRISADDGTPPASLHVLRAYCLNGIGRYQEAATEAARTIGFDLDTKEFRDDAAGTDEPDSIDDVRTATVLLATLLAGRLRDPDTAAMVLEHLVTAFPDDYQSWLALTRWRQSRGDFPGAAAAVRRASEIAPDEPDVLFTDRGLSIAEGRFDVADRLALKARQLFPTDDRSYRGQASVALRREAFDASDTYLRDGLAELPGRPELLLMLAEVLLKSDEHDEAEATLKEFVERYGDSNNTAGILQCRLLVQRKEWLAARQKLDALRPLLAGSEDLTRQVDLMLGQCHEMLGQFDEQLSANRRVLADDQESIIARDGVAAALLSSGKTDAAAVEYEGIATALGPERLAAMPQIWSPLLQLRIRAQRTRVPGERDWSRVDALLGALAESPAVSSAQLATVQADVLARKGDIPAAIQVLETALDVDGSNPRLLAALALLTLRQKGPTAARDLLARAPASVADDPVCLLVKVQTAASEPADRAGEALADLERTAAELPIDQALPLLTAIGTAYRGIGRPDDAERVWKEAMEKRPNDHGPRTLLFELACDRMDVERVRSAAEEIAKLAGPKSPEGRLAEAATLIVQARIARAAESTGDGGPDDPGQGLPPEQDPRRVAAKNLLIEAENDRPGWAQIQQLFADVAIM
ncbi:MAG: tetratricopeptide repeat protein, partial [Planctomycetia bacterium]